MRNRKWGRWSDGCHPNHHYKPINTLRSPGNCSNLMASSLRAVPFGHRMRTVHCEQRSSSAVAAHIHFVDHTFGPPIPITGRVRAQRTKHAHHRRHHQHRTRALALPEFNIRGPGRWGGGSYRHIFEQEIVSKNNFVSNYITNLILVLNVQEIRQKYVLIINTKLY